MGLTLVILAAGNASRYKKPKQLEPLGQYGHLLMDYAIYDAVQAGFEHFVIITKEAHTVQFQRHLEQKFSKKCTFDYVEQGMDSTYFPNREKPLGTGHALLCTQHTIQGSFAVINADDFYGREAFVKISDFLTKNPIGYCNIGYRLGNTLSENGTVSRAILKINDQQELTHIEEHTALDASGTSQHSGVSFPFDTPVSMNFWGFPIEIFDYIHKYYDIFKNTYRNQPTEEFLIPTVVEHIIRDNRKVKVIPTSSQWCGLTYANDRIGTETFLNELTAKGEYPKDLSL